ncbi:MAG: DUF1330 domain-containing protein [Acidimicrobiales bacterium]
MTSYVLGTIEITDPKPLEAYGEKVGPIIDRFGGRIRAIGPVTVLEGDANPTMAAVIEFDSAADAAIWYDSPEYGEIRGLRQASGHTSVVLVEVPGGDQQSAPGHGAVEASDPPGGA